MYYEGIGSLTNSEHGFAKKHVALVWFVALNSSRGIDASRHANQAAMKIFFKILNFEEVTYVFVNLLPGAA